jgi:UDP-N-acetyl-D-mannosaminuronic acid dehydrogenase
VHDVTIAVIGLGYIGLPTAAVFAQCGHHVYGYDANAQVRRMLQQGIVSVEEPPVRNAVKDALDAHHLQIVDVVPSAEAYVLCLPTPTHDGRPDLSFVENAAGMVAAIAEPGAIIVLESTVPPGTTERIVRRALASHGKAIDDFHVAHCPERVIPGAIMDELRRNARVVGAHTPDDGAIVRDLYASFCVGEIAVTSTAVAEFIKVIENTFRDVNIAFANELAIVAEELGIDVWESIAIANRHPRVDILAPGPGVGGHCIPVDPHFLADAHPFTTELIQSARRVNERMPDRIVRRVADLVEPAQGHKIALLGAAYKADVDDARESPTIRIDALLRERGYVTSIYDPLVKSFARPLCGTLEETVSGAAALILVTGHAAFRSLCPAEIASMMHVPCLVDTRHFFDTDAWERAGFACYVLGRPFKRAIARAVA